MERQNWLQGTLYRPQFEQDSCGFGLIAQLDDKPSHWLVKTAISSLAQLTHRGAVAADGNYAWSVKITGGPGYSGLDNTADGGSVAGTRPSDSSEGTKSLKSGTDVTTLAKNPWILGFGNTPISSTTIHKQ